MTANIFRQYDIHGILIIEFTDEIIINIGKGYSMRIVQHYDNTAVISDDVIISTNRKKQLFYGSLINTGDHIYNLSILPTPINNFSQYLFKIDGAVQKTGSYYQPEYNGLKLSYYQRAFTDDQIHELLKLILEQDFETGDDTIGEFLILEDYKSMLKHKIKIKQPLKL